MRCRRNHGVRRRGRRARTGEVNGLDRERIAHAISQTTDQCRGRYFRWQAVEC